MELITRSVLLPPGFHLLRENSAVWNGELREAGSQLGTTQRALDTACGTQLMREVIAGITRKQEAQGAGGKSPHHQISNAAELLAGAIA